MFTGSSQDCFMKKDSIDFFYLYTLRALSLTLLIPYLEFSSFVSSSYTMRGCQIIEKCKIFFLINIHSIQNCFPGFLGNLYENHSQVDLSQNQESALTSRFCAEIDRGLLSRLRFHVAERFTGENQLFSVPNVRTNNV